MFLLDKSKELDADLLGKIIQKFELKEKVKLNRYWNYYKGEQEIMRKVATDIGKPCNKIITNYCYNIAQNYQGYITGIPIAYSSDKDFTAIQEVLNYNDVKNEDSELLRNALIFGRAFEINYIDEEGKQRFKVLDSREVIPVYDTTLNNDLLYIIRYYLVDNVGENLDEYYVEVYTATTIRIYRSSQNFTSFSLLDERLHHYQQVPITVFSLNKEEESVFDKVMTLQDAYNKLLSSEVDDFEAFCDAYMVLKGCIAEDEDIKTMKQNRVLVLDNDASAEYLTKSVSDTQIENMLKNINDTIHKIANSPDFNDEKLLAQSGIAMRYKLVGFENVASSIVANMTKALQRRIELICEIIHLTGGEEYWRDINIIFTRNLPVNVLESAQVVNQLRGLVSDETLLTLLPFINNPQEEIERITKQKQENMVLYNFANVNETETEDSGE